MKIIVFGGSGFLGSHVADALTAAGHEVTIFDIKVSACLKGNQKMILGDILDEQAVQKAVAEANVVYHFAGIAGIEEAFGRPQDAIRYNILGTLNILEACRRANVCRIVFASTVYVCSRSGSIYRTTKRACESLIEDYRSAYGLNYTILRYGSLYGLRAGLNNAVYKMIYQALTEKKVKALSANPDDERKFINVKDAARLTVEVLDEKHVNQSFVLTGKTSMKIENLFGLVKKIVGEDISITYKAPDPNLHYNKHYDDQLRLLTGKEICIEDDLETELKELTHQIRSGLRKPARKIKTIIFDFDGVILESVDIKTTAFKRLFSDRTEHIEKIIKLHIENGGMSRYEKFKIIYRDFLREPLTNEVSQLLARRFSEIVFEEIIRCPFVMGAKELLDDFSDRYDLYVVSGTPEEELRSIVKKRGLERYFRAVYGSPLAKGEAILRILKMQSILPEEAVFIGDALNDFYGANEAGVKFIGRRLRSGFNSFREKPQIKVVDDLIEFRKLINEGKI